MNKGAKVTEYRIEHRTSGGNWVDEGYSFETLEDAQEEMEFLKGYDEKYRIVKIQGTLIYKAE